MILKSASKAQKTPVNRRRGVMRVADPSARRAPDGGSVAHDLAIDEWRLGVLSRGAVGDEYEFGGRVERIDVGCHALDVGHILEISGFAAQGQD